MASKLFALTLLQFLTLSNFPLTPNAVIIIKDSGPEVITPNGPLQGKWLTSRENKTYAAFEGIPFATIGERYKPAEPVTENWTELRNATVAGPVCPQYEMMSQQFIDHEGNCLFANVYVPMNDDDTAPPDLSLPVQLWIHGGAFLFGAGSFEGGHYMMDQSVVLITINYRLGNFGFLSLGDDEEEPIVSPNNGLRDQIEGLKWAQKNVGSFGGNPALLTITGESAGSASVHSLVLSPAAAGLFQQAVAQSGTLFTPWAIQNEPLAKAKLLAEKVGCIANGAFDSRAAIECLRAKSVRQLLEAELAMQGPSDLPFVPTIDRGSQNPFFQSILPDTPYNLVTLYQNNSAHLPIIIGHNVQEGLGTALSDLKDPQTVEKLNDNWAQEISFKLNLPAIVGGDLDKALKVAGKIKQIYFPCDTPVSNDTVMQLTNMYSDFSFIYGVRRAAILHAQRGAKVYPYNFVYQGKSSMTNLEGFPTQGVSHADDLQYLFDSTMTVLNWPDLEAGSIDDHFSKEFIKTYFSFVRTGKPVSWGDDVWTQLDKNVTEDLALSWLKIDQNPKMQVETEDFRRRMEFWSLVFSQKLDLGDNDGSGAGRPPAAFSMVLFCLSGLIVLFS